MESVFRAVLFLTGALHLLPFTLAFLPARIASSYGVEVSGADMMLLMRHRAVLFGIVGSIMVHSAWTKRNYSAALSIGLASMLSFVLLYSLIGGINVKLQQVMWIDLAASVALICAGAVRLFTSKKG